MVPDLSCQLNVLAQEALFNRGTLMSLTMTRNIHLRQFLILLCQVLQACRIDSALGWAQEVLQAAAEERAGVQ